MKAKHECVINEKSGDDKGSEHPLLKKWLKEQILENLAYAHECGIDKPEIRDWKWPYA